MNFTLNILGTASARPSVKRNPSAHVLNVRGRLFLIDCGEGAQVAIVRAGISLLKIDIMCLSHIHGDHVFGIFGLLSTMGMLGRTEPFHIYAPGSFAPVLKFFLSQFGEGAKFEIVHHVLEMKAPEAVYSDKDIELLAFPLHHRVETFGFLFKEREPALNVRKEAILQYGLDLSEISALKKGEDVVRDGGEVIPNSVAAYLPYIPRSYAYCSDTAPFPELSSWIAGVDLLYHEATFPAEMAEMAAATFHSTTIQAAQCALDAGVGKLVVGHYSSRYPDLSQYLVELRSVFAESYLGNDGDVIELPEKKL